MEARKQLAVLKNVWRGQTGYVFLPWIPAEAARDKVKRKGAWKESKGFAWPADQAAIVAHLEAHVDDDLYFTPCVFEMNERKEEYATAETRLWADLDLVNPSTIEDELKPTIAWESSPGSYQAVWVMNEANVGASWAGRENQKLTHHIGADQSGWDTTQLLRVPGSVNNKPTRVKGGVAPRGKLLWSNGPRHDWDTFEALNDIEGAESSAMDAALDEGLLDGIDRHATWARIKNQVSSQVRQYVRMRDSEGLDRSETAWQIERELADAGATLVEMVAIMRPLVWNKFEGRRDELKRLVIECSKALAQRDDESLELEADEPKPDTKLVPFQQDDDYLNAPEPEWLVDELIPVGGCGFISGIPKSMKSWVALDLAISLTSFEQFLGRDLHKACNVLYVQEEDPVSLVLQRHTIIASSKAPNDVPGSSVTPSNSNLHMFVQKGFVASDEGWQEWLSDAIRDNDIGMVIMDTLATVSGDVDMDNAKDAKHKLLNPIKRIARDTGAAMMFVNHMNKSSTHERAGQNMSGSNQVHAWTDFLIAIVNKDEKNVVDIKTETKYTGSRTLRYKLDGLDNDPKEWLVDEQYADDHAMTSGAAITGERDDDGLIEVDFSEVKEPRSKARREQIRRKNKAIHRFENHPQMVNAQIAAETGAAPDTVRKWRREWETTN